MADTPRAPVFNKPSRRQAGFLEPQQNMLLTTLMGVATLFVQQQVVEGVKVKRLADTVATGTTALNMPVEEEPEQAPLNSTLQVEGKKYRVKFPEPERNLQASTLATGALSTLGRNIEWGGKRKALRGDADPPNLLGTLLAEEEEPEATPFTQTDWAGKKKLLRGEEQAQNRLPLGSKPFGLIDWSGKKRVLRGESPIQNLLPLNVVVDVGTPFTNVDWSWKKRPVKGTIFYPARISGEGTPPPGEKPTATQDTWSVAKQKPRREDLQPRNLLTSVYYIRGLQPDVWPEPSRRKTKGFLEADDNRISRYLGTQPSLQPKQRTEWPEAELPRRVESTEYYNLLPLQIGPAPKPFGGTSFDERRIKRRYDASLQTPQPLTALFIEGDIPFLNVNWDGRSSIKRVGSEPVPTNLLLLGVDFGRPLLRNEPLEHAKPRAKQIDPIFLGSPKILLQVESMPFNYPTWPEGHGRANLRGQQVLSTEESNLTILLPIGSTPVDPPDPPTGSPPRTEAMEEYHVSNQLVDPAAQQELQRVEQVLQQFSGKGIRVEHVEPTKPIDGQSQIADGNDWDPMADGIKCPVWYDSATQTWKRFVPQNFLSSGVYTPTLFGVLNVAGGTNFECHYIRIGDVVHVAGRLNVRTSIPGPAILGISLPIGSNITSSIQVAGTAVALTDREPAGIQGDSDNNRAQMLWEALTGDNQGFSFTFTYRILS